MENKCFSKLSPTVNFSAKGVETQRSVSSMMANVLHSWRKSLSCTVSVTTQPSPDGSWPVRPSPAMSCDSRTQNVRSISQISSIAISRKVPRCYFLLAHESSTTSQRSLNCTEGTPVRTSSEAGNVSAWVYSRTNLRNKISNSRGIAVLQLTVQQMSNVVILALDASNIDQLGISHSRSQKMAFSTHGKLLETQAGANTGLLLHHWQPFGNTL